MLPKKHRLSQENFDHVYNNGESVSGDAGYIKVKRSKKPTKISCVVSSNNVDSSVNRTRIRRRAYASLEDIVDNIADNCSIIWFLPADASKLTIDELRAAFTGMLEKSSICGD